jgi:rhomboid family GlyGly-CTERM serine protease
LPPVENSATVRLLHDDDSSPWSFRTLPWVTALATVAALAIYFSPAATRLLAYDRLRIVDGEWWRVLTGNWVHFSGRELTWNLAVLMPAGVWAERLVPLRARVLFLVAPAFVGGVLYGFFTEISHFAGLSGVAAGVVAFLAIAQLRSTETDRWFWRLVLGLLALKIAAEAIVASRLVSAVPDPAARAVPLIHLAGITAASLVLSVRRRKR